MSFIESMIVGMLVVLAVAWTFNARRAVRGNDAARSDASASNWRWRDGIGEARMPPMMLLPLIDDALAACTNAVGPKPSIRVDLYARGDRLYASVTRTPGGIVPTDAPAFKDIRERLSGLYGDGASLAIAAPKTGCIEARLDIPLEFAPEATTERACSI